MPKKGRHGEKTKTKTRKRGVSVVVQQHVNKVPAVGAALVAVLIFLVYGFGSDSRGPLTSSWAAKTPTHTPKPLFRADPEQVTRTARRRNDDIAVSADRNAHAKFQPRRETATPKPAATPAPREVPAPQVADKRARRVVILIDVPHSGGETVDCSLGSMRKVVNATTLAQPVDPDALEMISVKNYHEAVKAVSNFGVTRGLSHIVPNASYVVTMSFKHPVTRVLDAFAAITYGRNKSFPCPDFDEAQRPHTVADLLAFNEEKGRKQITCERTRNLLVKTFLGLPLDVPVGLEEVEEAVPLMRNKNFTVFLDDEPTKSMYYLAASVGVKHLDYFQCTRHKPEPQVRDKERDVIYEENLVDMKFMEEARHRFYTRWASMHEQSFDQGGATCAPPEWCWHELGALHHINRKTNSVKRQPIAAVRLIEQPYCAAPCRF
eukprot:TRINITY_DN72938_c0_g1_i1.p1 TRINITY_DN72938_c0_g1~~TRINITY_DN72938_c0_g1_i1.p1  ORF type:complete len:451 (+),score=90.31 TRINITY_DN72938_c0_g1_i1:53-1354(+)